jgi:DNA-binding transcriptional LysR family regulator
MIDWDDLRVFLALAKFASQRSAGKYLEIDQATVGRRIKALETALGSKLFDRTSDGLVLNGTGQILLRQAKQVEDQILEIEKSTSARDQTHQGIIRLAMPGAMAHYWLMPHLRTFFENYPGITIQFLNGPEIVNLWRREVDMAIRLVKPTQKELFVRKICELKLAVYAAKNHLKILKKSHHKNPAPGSIQDVPFVGLYDYATTTEERELLAQLGPLNNVVCQTQAWSSVYYAIKAGIGVGILPSFFGRSCRMIHEVKDLPSSHLQVWLVMHPDVKNSARVKALVKYIVETQKNHKF